MAATLNADVQAKADTAMSALLDALLSREAGAKTGRTGRYRQLLADQSWGTWDAIKPDPATLTASVDQYLTPDGQVGYVVNGMVTDANGQWRRSVNVGPERWRTQGWQLQDKT